MLGLKNWFSGLWHDATYKVDIDEHLGGEKLVRSLGLWSVFLFTVTQAVGAGILTNPGIIASQYAGSHAWMSFLQAGLICAAPALCLARLATLSTRSGSTGSYACMAFGQLLGLLMFIDVAMECIGGTAAVAVSQAEHVKMALDMSFGLKLPDWLTETPTEVPWLYFGAAFVGLNLGAILAYSSFKTLKQQALSLKKRVFQSCKLTVGFLLFAGGAVSCVLFLSQLHSINLLSMGIIVLVTLVLMRGIGETKLFTNIFTVVKLLVIATVVVLLAMHYDPSLLSRPIPAGMPGTLGGASVAFFAYVGLDMATTAAGETKNPKRNIPMGMLLGLIAVIALYVAATYFLCAAVPFEQLAPGGKGTAAPMAKALEILGYKSATIWVTVGSTVALISVLLASAYSTTRLLFNMAQHKMLPAVFEKVNHRQVPVVATLVVGASIATLTALLAVDELMHLTNIGTMTCFITASAIVLVKVLRETQWSDRRKALSGAFWVLVAILGILGPARLMIELPLTAFIRLAVVWSIVIGFFVFYGRHHSLARSKTAEPGPLQIG